MKKLLICLLGVLFCFSFLPTYQIFAASDAGWTIKKPLSSPRNAHSTTTLNGNIYAIGGLGNEGILKSVEAYNPTTDSWKPMASMNVQRYRPKAVSFDNQIYVFGGATSISPTTYTDSVEVYNPNTDKWTIKTKMSSTRSDVLAAEVNNKIYVIGGILSGGKLSNSVEEYDPVQNTWLTKASIPAPRQTSGIAVVDNKIYVMAGTSGGWDNTIQIYDPVNDSWISKDIPFKRANFGIATVNNKIYVIGGNDPSLSPNTTNEVKIYDPLTDTWGNGPSLSVARTFGVASVLDGNIYSIGGTISNTGFTGLNEMLVIPTSQNEFILNGENQGNHNYLSWSNLGSGYNYELKRSLTPGGPYEVIDQTKNTDFTDKNIQQGQTYYYIVTATSVSGLIIDSNEIALTLQDESNTGSAILTITLTNGTLKEYDLPMSDVNAFLNWYDSRDAGTGPVKFAINKYNNNKGPFSKRTDYVIFDKILTFEVNEYTNL